MIKRFRSKALKLAFDGNTSKLIPNVAQRIVDVLDELNGATSLDDLRDLTGFHELKGDRAGEYAITITANWRLTFSPLSKHRPTKPRAKRTRSFTFRA